MRFEFLPHTADVKIKVYGKNFDEIINNSLLALKSFFKPKLSNKRKIVKDIKVSNKNEIELLIDFLSEVLAQTYIEKAIFIKSKVKIEPKVKMVELRAKITGYQFSKISRDIKAITYHQAKLEKIDDSFIFEFIIDI